MSPKTRTTVVNIAKLRSALSTFPMNCTSADGIDYEIDPELQKTTTNSLTNLRRVAGEQARNMDKGLRMGTAA